MAASYTEVNWGSDTRVNKNKQISVQQPRWRILYALGPGDVVGLYRDLLEGREPAFQPGKAFSKQFLDWCNEAGAAAHVMSYHSRREVIQDGLHIVENRPKHPLYYQRGLKHHLGSILYGLTVLAEARRERATVVVADSGTTHWIVLSLLSVLRVPVIAVLLNSLWPMGFPPSRRSDRILSFLDGVFFRRVAAATVCISPECERQIRTAAGRLKGPVYQFRPQYREGFLSRVNPVPQHSIRPFRVLFLGRIEEVKGVFLILSIAERLERELPGQFAWKIVGSGPASEALERQVEERKLARLVEVPGRLANEQEALETFGWAHCHVVPTTGGFSEGLAMTAAEAVLAGRPVVMSKVVPAWEVLGEAAIRAETNNVDSFVDAFRKLALEPVS
jgi:glycosyltransferase involved in cell wall biosynthesis